MLNRALLFLAVLAVSLLLVFVLYWPGIQSGGFYLDDHGNLSVLGQLGGVDSWESLSAYLHSGVSGVTGRPLSLLSFLVDGRDWPTDAQPFLRTNPLSHG